MRDLKRMRDMHSFVYLRNWDDLQNAILKDPGVSVRVVDVADEGKPRLRYWVGSDAPSTDTQAATVAEKAADREMCHRRTLLHSIFRLDFPSNDELAVQLSHGCGEEKLQDLVQATKTAEMLIEASLGCTIPGHNSILTMKDWSGDTPLHSLTGRGDSHPDMVEVVLSSLQRDGSPRLRELLAFQNDHGCTPLHHLADAMKGEILRLMFDGCKVDDGSEHPLLISDNDSDLPLHYACANSGDMNAKCEIIRLLVEVEPRSVLVANSMGRLAIDEHILAYLSEIEEGSQSFSAQESDDESTSSGESASSSDESEGPVSAQDGESCDKSSGSHEVEGISYKNMIHRARNFILKQNDWRLNLWQPMWILTEVAANLIQVREDWLPLQAATIATKYAKFPALVLALCANDSYASKEVDSFGHLALHYGCGDVAQLLGAESVQASVNIVEATILKNNGSDAVNPGSSPYLSRFGSQDFPLTLIQWLVGIAPSTARTKTLNRLPLHLLLAACNEMKWSDVELLLELCPRSLKTRDPTQLYPFQLASVDEQKTKPASEEQIATIDTTFRLLLKDPSLVLS